ncbi:MAG: cation transporter, partial [Clostridia bacterium]
MDKMKTEKFNIKGMTCSACAQTIERKVKSLPGAGEVNVNLLSNSMEVDYDTSRLSSAGIAKAVKKAGYQVVQQENISENPLDGEMDEMKRRLLLSILFVAPLFYIYMGSMLGLPLPGFMSGHANMFNFAFIQFLLVLPVAIINRKFFTVGFRALFLGSPNMDSLIAIGTSAAISYGVYALFRINHAYVINDHPLAMEYAHDLYFETAGIILLLITVGKFLEAKAKGR